jgi:hypothetical protein
MSMLTFALNIRGLLRKAHHAANANRYALQLVVIAFFVGSLFGRFSHSLYEGLMWMAIPGIGAHSVLSFVNIVTARKISLGFLTDVTAFETAIIAFLIPLSLEMISKISERYKSEVVLLPFHHEWENRILLKLLLVNVMLALPLRFWLDDKQPIEGWWRLVVWFLLANFVFTTVTIYTFMRKLRRYMSDTSFLIEKLFSDATRSING